MSCDQRLRWWLLLIVTFVCDIWPSPLAAGAQAGSWQLLPADSRFVICYLLSAKYKIHNT